MKRLIIFLSLFFVTKNIIAQPLSSDFKVHDMSMNSNNELWITTNEGLIIFDTEKNQKIESLKGEDLGTIMNGKTKKQFEVILHRTSGSDVSIYDFGVINIPDRSTGSRMSSSRAAPQKRSSVVSHQEGVKQIFAAPNDSTYTISKNEINICAGEICRNIHTGGNVLGAFSKDSNILFFIKSKRNESVYSKPTIFKYSYLNNTIEVEKEILNTRFELTSYNSTSYNPISIFEKNGQFWLSNKNQILQINSDNSSVIHDGRLFVDNRSQLYRKHNNKIQKLKPRNMSWVTVFNLNTEQIINNYVRNPFWITKTKCYVFEEDNVLTIYKKPVFRSGGNTTRSRNIVKRRVNF